MGMQTLTRDVDADAVATVAGNSEPIVSHLLLPRRDKNHSSGPISTWLGIVLVGTSPNMCGKNIHV